MISKILIICLPNYPIKQYDILIVRKILN